MFSLHLFSLIAALPQNSPVNSENTLLSICVGGVSFLHSLFACMYACAGMIWAF